MAKHRRQHLGRKHSRRTFTVHEGARAQGKTAPRTTWIALNQRETPNSIANKRGQYQGGKSAVHAVQCARCGECPPCPGLSEVMRARPAVACPRHHPPCAPPNRLSTGAVNNAPANPARGPSTSSTPIAPASGAGVRDGAGAYRGAEDVSASQGRETMPALVLSRAATGAALLEGRVTFLHAGAV